MQKFKLRMYFDGNLSTLLPVIGYIHIDISF